MPSGLWTMGPACSTMSPVTSARTGSLSSAGPARTITSASPLPAWKTALQRGAWHRIRYCGPPTLEASAVTQPHGWMGILMHPCARPAVRTRGIPFCCSASPGDVRRSSALARETPARTTRSSRSEARTRHQAPREPLPQETGSHCSTGSPSEMWLASESDSTTSSSIFTCCFSGDLTGFSMGLTMRVSMALRWFLGGGFANSSAKSSLHMSRRSSPYSLCAGAQRQRRSSCCPSPAAPWLEPPPPWLSLLLAGLALPFCPGLAPASFGCGGSPLWLRCGAWGAEAALYPPASFRPSCWSLGGCRGGGSRG
mmetsp:Transcript_61262/g.179644  ORF Transcript_61262/g.179644 Transcript_61262/m.179644 type:complete len:311 (-) Transcript_61262:122-1054(-)